jgi:hypothetical protein
VEAGSHQSSNAQELARRDLTRLLQLPGSRHNFVDFDLRQSDNAYSGHYAPAQMNHILGGAQYRLFQVYHKPHVDEHFQACIFGNQCQMLLVF